MRFVSCILDVLDFLLTSKDSSNTCLTDLNFKV